MPGAQTCLTELRAMAWKVLIEAREEIDPRDPDWATGPQGYWGELDWVYK